MEVCAAQHTHVTGAPPPTTILPRHPFPHRKSATYFTKVKMSALALVKIVMHAKTGKGKAGRISSDSGNWIEVMGVMQGYVKDDCFIILDSFALPVEAHEVECNLTQEATEYLVTYIQKAEKVGKGEPVVGWYHSHPGYQCFLSKMDCVSQRRYQQYSDPFIAVVVDPVRTISTGKVEVKAFRTLPESEVVESAGGLKESKAGADKIEEMGVYAHWYKELPIEVFKSSSDEEALTLLWGQFWSSTLASSPLITNRFFIDRQIGVVEKALGKTKGELSMSHGAAGKGPGTTVILTGGTGAAAGPGGSTAGGSGGGGGGGGSGGSSSSPLAANGNAAAKKENEGLAQALKASDSLAGEVLHGLLGVVAKDAVFNMWK